MRSTYDVLTGRSRLRDAILSSAVPQLSIAASTLDLSGLELEIAQARDRAFRLRHAPEGLNADAPEQPFGYVLVDCPPSLNLLTVNAMAAADAVISAESPLELLARRNQRLGDEAPAEWPEPAPFAGIAHHYRAARCLSHPVRFARHLGRTPRRSLTLSQNRCVVNIRRPWGTGSAPPVRPSGPS